MTIEKFSKKLIEIVPLLFREMAKREDNALIRGKITWPQMVALHVATQKTQVTMTELSHALSIQMSSTTALIDRMIRDGLLRRERDAADRRLVWVRITNKGHKVINQILVQKRQLVTDIYSCLTGPERDQYLKILLKVQKFLEEKHGECVKSARKCTR